MLSSVDRELGQKALEGMKAAYDRVVMERDVLQTRLDEAEMALMRANILLEMAETVMGPRTKPGPERVNAAWAFMDAMREAGFEVDPPR